MVSMAGMQIMEMLEEFDKAEEPDYKLLDTLHHFSAGFKALSTSYAYYGIDELRQACGGAGFTLASGIADLWTDVAPYVTLEGVNTVMFQ
jgi:acyl-CoA oxidase